jgi:radical SAM superfamily enzyme YgiQ (UPF0313 family)
MSNLGFHNLFHRVSSFPGIRTARFFLERNGRLFSPDKHYSHKRDMFKGSVPSLQGFDGIFFTVSFELDYINILRMLSLSFIPILVEERGGNKPFVLTGGITVSANPEVLTVFSDVVFVGDMEENLENILGLLLESSFIPSSPLRDQLSLMDGVFIDGLKDSRVKRAVSFTVECPAHTVVLTKNTEFADRFLIEVTRGCRNSCAFCMTRCTGSPIRMIPESSVLESTGRAAHHVKGVGLVGPVLTDHTRLSSIVHGINDMGLSVSFSSLRADRFTNEVAELLKRNKQTTLTFAPETGEDGLRRKIGKDLTNVQLLEAVILAMEYGIKHFRYYFMYGLPWEKEEDIEAIIALVKETLVLFDRSGCSLHISINPFIPKKGTPLDARHLYPMYYYSRVQQVLEDELKKMKNVTVRFESLRMLFTQALLSTGSRETGLLLYRTFLENDLQAFARFGEKMLSGHGDIT